MLQPHWPPLSLSPEKCCLVSVTSACSALPPNNSLDWLFLDFQISAQVLPRQKGPGRTLPNFITITLLNFLSSTDIVLFVYLFILLLQRSFMKAEFLVANSVYTEKALKYLLIEWLNGGLNIVFLGLPFVLCLVLLVIIVSPNACGMEVLSFSCSLCFPIAFFFFFFK